MSKTRIAELRKNQEALREERAESPAFGPPEPEVPPPPLERKRGRPPSGEQKRSERIVLTMTKEEMGTLKKEAGRVALGTWLRDHCEKTGFFPESNVEDDETDHLVEEMLASL